MLRHEMNGYSLHSVESTLKNHLEDQPLPLPAPEQPGTVHGNIRGAGYYDPSLEQGQTYA